MVRTKKTQAPQTTAQQLSSLIKSVRQILRKDKGLNGDLDRLPLSVGVRQGCGVVGSRFYGLQVLQNAV